MSEGDGMATDGDREKAMQIMAWDPLSYEGLAQAVEEGNDPDDRDSLETIDAIARALAEEREKARAAIRASWDEQCAGYKADTCESCRAYQDAIDSIR